MSDIIETRLRPGGMLSDVVEDEFGEFQWRRVENLRQLKKGEFDLPPGYRNILTGLTDSKGGIEITEDVSNDRFLLVQDGVDIKRIDYDIANSPIFGYESESPVTLPLPSGITISATATLRFFQFRGIVRISGASEPLWYGYVDRMVFPGDDTFTIQNWVLEKAALFHVDNDIEVLSATGIPHATIGVQSDLLALFMKFFYEFDDGQYQLLRIPDTSALSSTVFGFPEEISPANSGAFGAQIEIRIPGAALKDDLFNKRITGVGIAFATVKWNPVVDETSFNDSPPEIYKEELEPFFVPEILRISTTEETEIKKIGFALTVVNWDSGSPTELEISDPLETWAGSNGNLFLPPVAGYLGVGVKVGISFGGTTVDTTVATIDFGDFVTKAVLTVDDSLSSLFGATGVKFNVGFNITIEWQYDAADGYKTYFGLNLLALGTFYEDFTQIPAGTTQNTPNWSIIEFLSERAFCAGQTGDIGATLIASGTTQEVTIIEDNFVDTNGVLLTAHTMDIGNGWISGDGVATIFEIQSNEAHDSSGNLGETLYTESNRSDNIKITGRMVLNHANDAVSIKFRYVDENNHWQFNYLGSNLAFVSLVRIVGGIATTRDTEAHTISDGVSVTFEIELVGDIITAKTLTPEAHTISTTDSAHLTATKHGFASDNANVALVIVDTFKITEDVLVPDSNAVANDDFTDSNGVALTAHTMPLGNGWTSAGVQWEIQSNEARDSGAGSGELVITDLQKSDKLIITGKIKINHADDETRFTFRHFTLNDQWYFAYLGSTDPKFELKRVIAGAHTVQQTTAHTVAEGVFVSFQITLNGSSIELKILSPEVYTLQITDTTHQSETSLGFYSLAGNTGVSHIDDLVVVETVANFIIESFENDTVRHTPPGQLDNFPISNAIQTEVGDTDEIINLQKRDNQLVILKKKSISVGGFSGSDYTENVSISKHGLFSPLGVLSATLKLQSQDSSNEFLMLIDQDDLYLFNGINAISFFESVQLREFYKSNVAATSFILLDKKNGELMFFLGSEILVWRMHTGEFYIRNTDVTPLFGFLDSENKLVLGTTTKFLTFNHELGVPYDESMSYLLNARVTDNGTPHRLKKLKELHSYLLSEEDVTITLSDVQGDLPGTPMEDTRGVIDHWIATCPYMDVFSGDPCYGILEFWDSTKVGRTRFIVTPTRTIQLVQNQINGLDALNIADPNPATGSLLQIQGSDNNPDYKYLQEERGWIAIIWKQTATSLTDDATLFQNDGRQDIGFSIHVTKDSAGFPNAFAFRITSAAPTTTYVDINTGSNKVTLGGWNYAIVSWEETLGRNGIRIILNGTTIDFDGINFTGIVSSFNPQLLLNVAERAGTQGPPNDLSVMDIVELGAGNVGLTNSEMLALEDYIQGRYAIPLELIPVKVKTITDPSRLKPRIEKCNYLFKELQVEIKNATNSSSLTAQIRDFLLRIERWQKE